MAKVGRRVRLETSDLPVSRFFFRKCGSFDVLQSHGFPRPFIGIVLDLILISGRGKCKLHMEQDNHKADNHFYSAHQNVSILIWLLFPYFKRTFSRFASAHSHFSTTVPVDQQIWEQPMGPSIWATCPGIWVKGVRKSPNKHQSGYWPKDVTSGKRAFRNISSSGYSTHTLNTRHRHGTITDSTVIIRTHRKGTHLNTVENCKWTTKVQTKKKN
jgi:hypothetical protein